MNFTNSPYETMMKAVPYPAPGHAQGPQGSRCDGCPYWRGIACMSCYRDLLKPRMAGGDAVARELTREEKAKIRKLVTKLVCQLRQGVRVLTAGL